MTTFTPPTVYEGSSDPFWGRYPTRVGQSVVKMGSTFELTPYPWLGDLEGKTEGTDYFLGGRTYEVTEEIAVALEIDGFDINAFPGFGEGPFGGGIYGD